MEYVKRTLAYMFRAFWVLALVCLPAAAVLGVFTQPMASLSYLPDYADTYVRGFKDIFWLIFNRYATRYVYPLLLIFIALVFCSSLALSVVEKHFRTGKCMLRAPLKQINNYVLPVIFSYGIMALILVLYGLLQTGAVTLLHMVISGKGYPTVLNMTIAAVVGIGLFALSCFAACSALYWTPAMVIYGFSLRDAATYSLRLIDRKAGGIWAGVLLPFLVVALLQSFVSLIGIGWIRMVAAIVLYLFLLLYMLVYIMVSFFDLTDTERRDEKVRLGRESNGV